MTTTGMLILVAMIVLGIWDAYIVIVKKKIQLTESWTIRDICIHFPFVILTIGYCLGHIFSGMTPE